MFIEKGSQAATVPMSLPLSLDSRSTRPAHDISADGLASFLAPVSASAQLARDALAPEVGIALAKAGALHVKDVEGVERAVKVQREIGERI